MEGYDEGGVSKVGRIPHPTSYPKQSHHLDEMIQGVQMSHSCGDGSGELVCNKRMYREMFEVVGN